MGSRIQAERTERGLTLQTLADRSGVLPDDRGVGRSALRVDGDQCRPVPIDSDRGDVCEVHPDRSQIRTAIRFEPIALPDVTRDDLVLDQDVWDAVDEKAT